MDLKTRLNEFVAWSQQNIRGDEIRDAQIFLDRLFKAMGHDGALEAGGDFESRVRRKRDGKASVSFADYLLPGIVLIEMKKRGEDLSRHYDQLEDYWKNLGADKPRYALLCNFDEIWVYDFPTQFYDPVDKISIADIASRSSALEFLIAGSRRAPVFQYNLVNVTREAAFKLAQVFQSVLTREPREVAQRFILQCMVALFAEDIALLPDSTFTRAIETCQRDEESSYDLFTQLFTYMNTPGITKGRKFAGVDYFNGGIFSVIHPVHLTANELYLLREAARENWAKIRPAIFGTIFEDSLTKKERHQIGAHFTSEQDIKRIVDPVIVAPWDARIDAATTPDALYAAHRDLCAYRVLDPACGSGNFLYIAYRELKQLEARIFDRLRALGAPLFPEGEAPRTVSARQFYGLDINPFAVELAKVTLMIAKKLAVDEFNSPENPLPLDNLDDNIRVADALEADWPPFDAVIGNPPYLGAKRLKVERGVAYVNRVRALFPDVPGNADYCVYWFRKAHDAMQPGDRAGLVGTNTIRQNYSRIGGLDYIVAHDGHIFEAVSSMPWSGEAAVHVSVACWSKGAPPVTTGRLWLDDGTRAVAVPGGAISSALSLKTDVSAAVALRCNTEPKRVFQGQIPGHEAFILTPAEAREMVKRDFNSKAVIHPYLIGRDLTAQPGGRPSRYVIDLNDYDLVQVQHFRVAYQHIETHVLPVRKAKAEAERSTNESVLAANPVDPVNHTYQQAMDIWWKHTARRETMMRELAGLSRYIVCSRVTKRPIFEFAKLPIRPSDLVQVFVFDDDYSFGILQSNLHWNWFIEKASTLKSDYRYTPHSVFDTFPWPQQPAAAQVQAVAAAARALHEYRRDAMRKADRLTLRDLYRTLEKPGKNPLRELHTALDAAVMNAYGFAPDADPLAQLLALNTTVAARLAAGEAVTAPGIPGDFPDPAALVSAGCIEPPDLAL